MHLQKIIMMCAVIAFAKAYPQQPTVKNERETSISRTEMPAKALQLLKQFGYNDYKFYRETDGDRTSYEAKTEVDGHNYSIEFLENGTPEDIEIEVKASDLPEGREKALREALDKVTPRNRLKKIQLQYRFSEDGPAQMKNRISRGDYDHYEVIAGFKTNKDVFYMELLYDRSFNLLQKRKIERRAYNFLLF